MCKMETLTPVSGRDDKLMINFLGYFRIILLVIFIHCRKEELTFVFLNGVLKSGTSVSRCQNCLLSEL